MLLYGSCTFGYSARIGMIELIPDRKNKNKLFYNSLEYTHMRLASTVSNENDTSPRMFRLLTCLRTVENYAHS